MSWLHVRWVGIGSILRPGWREERTGRREKRGSASKYSGGIRRTTFFFFSLRAQGDIGTSSGAWMSSASNSDETARLPRVRANDDIIITPSWGPC